MIGSGVFLLPAVARRRMARTRSVGWMMTIVRGVAAWRCRVRAAWRGVYPKAGGPYVYAARGVRRLSRDSSVAWGYWIVGLGCGNAAIAIAFGRRISAS